MSDQPQNIPTPEAALVQRLDNVAYGGPSLPPQHAGLKVVFDPPNNMTANQAVIDAAVANQRASVLELVSTFSKKIGADKVTSVTVLGATSFSDGRHVVSDSDTVGSEIFVEPDMPNETSSQRRNQVQTATVTSLDNTTEFAKETWHVEGERKVTGYTVMAVVKYKDENGVENQALLVSGDTPKIRPLQDIEESARQQNPNVQVITASDLRKDQKEQVAMRNSKDTLRTNSL